MKQNNIFTPNKLVPIIAYVILMYILGSFIAMFLAVVLSSVYNVDTKTAINSLMSVDFSSLDAKVAKVSALSQGYGNLITYLLLLAFVILYLRDELVNDFKKIKERMGFFISFTLVSLILFVILGEAISTFITEFVEESTNQQTIVGIMTNGGLLPMMITTIICAPIVEELIFRKCIFHFFKRYGVVACYVASTLLFALPHMLSSDITNFGNWLLQLIPYAFSGIMLAFIYHKSNYNVFTSMLVHIANNIWACTFVLYMN